MKTLNSDLSIKYSTKKWIIQVAIPFSLLFSIPWTCKKQYNECPHNIIIDCNDISGSIRRRKWPKPNNEIFKEQIEFLEHNNGGYIYYFEITDAVPVPLRLEVPSINWLKKFLACDYFYEDYFFKKDQFLSDVNRKINNTKLNKESDYSYVNMNIRAIAELLETPCSRQSMSYILLITDFINHEAASTPSLVDASLIERLSNSCATIGFCNFNNSDFPYELNAIPLSSYSDFIFILKSSKAHN